MLFNDAFITETGIEEFSVPCDVRNDEENHNYGDWQSAAESEENRAA